MTHPNTMENHHIKSLLNSSQDLMMIVFSLSNEKKVEKQALDIVGEIQKLKDYYENKA